MIISHYLTTEHRHCDELFAQAESAAVEKDWGRTQSTFLDFANATLLHFKKEEEEFFPTFEAKTGSSDGPTQVMRFEHDQVRGLISKIAEAIEREDRDAYLSLGESMMILLQQHNMKEEQMLYAMADRVFSPELKEETVAAMKEMQL
jgi:hemerythrin-like domain-containing protein